MKSLFKTAPIPVALGLFCFLLFRPAYMACLRHQMQVRLPQEWAQLSTNGSFALLVPQLFASRYHDEAHYASRVHQIFLHGVPHNPYWREDRSPGSWVHDSVCFYLLAGISLLFGGNLNLTWIFTTALLGALWFLLLHRVFWWWCGRHEVAIPLALFSILFPDLYIWLLDINFNVTTNWERYAATFFQHHCTIRPQFYRLPSLFLSLFLLCLLLLKTWQFASRPQRYILGSMLLGLGYGFMALVHSYEFVFGMATLTVFLGTAWIFPQAKLCRANLIAIFLSALAATVGYAVFMILSVEPQARKDSLELMGLVHSHRPYLITLIHLLTAGFGLHQMRQETDPPRRAVWLLLTSAQLAVFLCRNSQVITGITMQPYHFIPMGSFLGCLMLFLWLSRTLSGKPWWDKRLGIAASLLIAVWAFSNEKASAERNYLMMGMPRDTEAALGWVRDRVVQDSLILSLSMETNQAVPLYTSAKVQVATISVPVAGPFSKEKFLYKIAQLLKTCRVDVDRFIQERWLLPKDLERVRTQGYREQSLLQKVDTLALEQGVWFYSYMHGNLSDQPILEAQQRLKALVTEVPPLKGPYYFWINEKDTPFIREPPERRGGNLVYRNNSVRIYEF
ncbi:MAG: hypothetical protein HY399_08730 [Elusimicrobia bacterium]|nr:hypothetical protein [Elusimicrobiota bacterium]